MSNSSIVPKTIKLFIGGEFPRTESGRSFPILFSGSQNVYAQACLSSRKDLRNAIQVAEAAQASWMSRSAYNRAQILYRMAEMFESKKTEFISLCESILGQSSAEAQKEVQQAQEVLLYYAGFADKYSQVMASVNPVSGPFHNFTTPEAMGVVGLVYDKKFLLSQFVAQIMSVICSGNTVVCVFDAPGAVFLSELAEVFKTSDLPGGVINLLSGSVNELLEPMATHMEINGLLISSDNTDNFHKSRQWGVDNMKRVVPWNFSVQSLEPIMAFTEAKTVWHPVGL